MNATDIDGALGMFDSEKNTVMTIKESMVNFNINPHKHIITKNKDKIEKKCPSLVFVWGDESEQEILTKVLSVDSNESRYGIFILFQLCFKYVHPERIKNVALSLKSSYPEVYKMLDITDIPSDNGIKESGCLGVIILILIPIIIFLA